jgi:flagellar capping protein FliD
MVDNRSESLRERLKRNQTDQDRVNSRIEATRQRLLRQYQSLDSRVTQLNGLGNYVAQQFSPRV